jgi:DNA polymerase-4
MADGAGADHPEGPEDLADAECTVLHIDMDAFYASVEVRHDPGLRGHPVIVGGGGSRGVVLSATYEARTYGVHSAMPVSRARRLCPQALVVTPHFERYQQASSGIMAVFRDVTPRVQPLSLDEAFLDVSGTVRRLGSPAQIAALVKARIGEEQGLPCTVGVASTMFVAKLASTRGKPDGLLIIRPEEVVAFLHPLPVTALWGVGERTAETLVRLGLPTVADVAHTPVATLQRALGRQQGSHLAELAWGRDPRQVSGHAPEKSIGADETFSRDVDDPEVIRRELLRLADKVGRRLRQAGLQAQGDGARLRFADFTTITRSRTLREATDVGRELHTVVVGLYAALGLDRARIRLVGVRAEGLTAAGSTATQLSFDQPVRDRRDAELASDRAERRFGAGVVRPGSLVSPPGEDDLP